MNIILNFFLKKEFQTIFIHLILDFKLKFDKIFELESLIIFFHITYYLIFIER